MRKMFIFYLPFNEEEVFKIETQSRYIRDTINCSYITTWKQKPLKRVCFWRKNFVLRIDLSSEKINKESKSLSCSVNFSYLNHKDRPIFLFSTPMGSWVKIDYLKRYARASLIKSDSLGEYLLLKASYFILTLIGMFRIHSVWIKINRSSLLFIGEKGAGKTTLAELLLREDRKSKIFEDDCTFVFPVADSIYAFSINQNVYYPINYLFFIEKKINKLSEVYPISHKEAFKRIVFHSDIILKKDDNQIEYRLNTLEKLVFGCKCFILINGKDLKDNSKRLKGLMEMVL